MFVVQNSGQWRAAVAALSVAVAVLGFGFILRVEGLGAAANAAQLVSLVPLLVAVTSWARTRRGRAQTEEPPISLSSALGYLADGHGTTRDELRRHLTNWPAGTVDAYLDGTQLPKWDFVAAYLDLIASDNAWHQEALYRRVRPVWQVARDSQAQRNQKGKTGPGWHFTFPWTNGRPIRRYQSVTPWQVTFLTLNNFDKMFAAAIDENDFTEQRPLGLYGTADFITLKALADAVPRQAVIDAWGRLEYELNIASDRIAAGQPHGWPQVTRNLETWDKWTLIYPAIIELRRLRDYVVGSQRPPSRSDARRYVSVAEDLATILHQEFAPEDGSA